VRFRLSYQKFFVRTKNILVQNNQYGNQNPILILNPMKKRAKKLTQNNKDQKFAHRTIKVKNLIFFIIFSFITFLLELFATFPMDSKSA
jgi:hypothetical protein